MRNTALPSPSLLIVAASMLSACSGQAVPPATPAPAPPSTSVAETPPAAATAAPASPAHEARPSEPPHFMYEGPEGPAHWGELWPEWKTCSTGQEQSPIDLSRQAEKGRRFVPLATSYQKIPLAILNNGHTVQATGTSGGKLTLDGKAFELVQFHLHAPSEHTLGGKPLDMELHLVHKDASGALAVVGVLLKQGKENRVLAPVFQAAPRQEGKEAVPVPNASVDLGTLLPPRAAYYSYPGSLTTPPCSEGVRWFVLSSPLEVSEAQVKQFRSVLHGDTARPTQPLGARKLTENRP